MSVGKKYQVISRFLLFVAVIAVAFYAGTFDRHQEIAVVAPAAYDGALLIDESVESQAAAGKIVLGRVTNVASFKEPGTIKTAIRIEVDEYVKGEGETELVLTMDGGTVGNETIDVGGVPRFAEGERVLLLLDDSAAPELLNRSQSKYSLAGSQAYQHGQKPSQSIQALEQDLSSALNEPVDLPETPGEVTNLQFTTYCATWSTAAMPVLIEVNPANPGAGGPSGAEFSRLSYESWHAWQALADSYPSFSYSGTTTRDGNTHGDGFNTIAWANDLGAGTLGVNWCATSGGVRVDSDTLINNVNFTWDADDSDGISISSYSLQSVMEHELGHGLGMGHSDQSCNGSASTPLMCPAISNGVRKVILADDQAGAASRYPLGGGAPGVPSGLGTTGGSASINLSWSAASGSPIAYDVERGDDACTNWEPVGTVAGTSFVDDDFAGGLSAGSYCYRVKALGTGGDSAWSNTVAANALGTPIYSPASGDHQLSATEVGSEVAIFGRNSSNQIWYRETSSGTFQGWTFAGSGAASRPEAITAAGDVFVFFRGVGNDLRYVRRSSGSWSSELSLGGRISGAPAAAVDGQGRLMVMVLNPYGKIWYRIYSSGSWSSWTKVSGVLAGQISLVNHQGDLYAIGLNGAGRTWVRAWEDSSQTWGSWTGLGGVLESEFAAVSNGTSLYAIGVNHNGFTYYKALTSGSWSGWISLGGILVSNPAAASTGSSLVYRA